MIWLIIYIVGFVIVLAWLLYELRYDTEITVGDIISILTISIFSWVIVIMALMMLISCKLEDIDWKKRFLIWNKVIIHKKK